MSDKKSSKKLEPIIWKYLYASKLGLDIEDVNFDEIINEKKASKKINKSEILDSKKIINVSNELFVQKKDSVSENKKSKNLKETLEKTIDFQKIKELTEKKEYPQVYNYYKEIFQNFENEEIIDSKNNYESLKNKISDDIDKLKKDYEEESFASYSPEIENRKEIRADSDLEENFDDIEVTDEENLLSSTQLEQSENLNRELTYSEKTDKYNNLISDIDNLNVKKSKLKTFIYSIFTLGAFYFFQKSRIRKIQKINKLKLINEIKELNNKIKGG